MLKKKLEKALNNQINREFFSSYLYLAMAIYCESSDLPGFAQWLMAQSREEYDHAEKLIKFVQDRDGNVVLNKIENPTATFESVLDVFKKVFAHEQGVSQHINDIYALAIEEKDYASQVEMQWYVKEQVEEEKTAQDIVKQLKRIGNKDTALFMFDQKMGERQIVTNVTE
jgi:ferritin